MRHFRVLTIGLALAVGPNAIQIHAQGPVVAENAEVQLLADGFEFTEGPAADAQGNVFFTDQPNDRIMKWSIDGVLSTFLQPAGRSNGLYFDREGNLLACADEKNQLWSIDPQGNVKVLIADYQGKLLNGPNDLWVAPDGGIYFTDPLYKRPYWQGRGGMEQDGQHVYYLSADRKSFERVIEGLVQPNGIIGTPDGDKLYVADIGDRKTYSFDLAPGGVVTNKQLFCEIGSDGMTLDEQGNVYLTGQGVTVFDSAGHKVAQIDVSEPWTANVTFGGEDHRTLFITASKGLYAVRMKVRGALPSTN